VLAHGNLLFWTPLHPHDRAADRRRLAAIGLRFVRGSQWSHNGRCWISTPRSRST
jgi:hypothetical protein